MRKVDHIRRSTYEVWKFITNELIIRLTGHIIAVFNCSNHDIKFNQRDINHDVYMIYCICCYDKQIWQMGLSPTIY